MCQTIMSRMSQKRSDSHQTTNSKEEIRAFNALYLKKEKNLAYDHKKYCIITLYRKERYVSELKPGAALLDNGSIKSILSEEF